jgi:hypothetical protein
VFKKNQFVIKVIDVRGSKSATVRRVAKVVKGVALIEDSTLKYDAETGVEVDAAFAFTGGAINSYIVAFDGGEAERLGLDSRT